MVPILEELWIYQQRPIGYPLWTLTLEYKILKRDDM